MVRFCETLDIVKKPLEVIELFNNFKKAMGSDIDMFDMDVVGYNERFNNYYIVLENQILYYGNLDYGYEFMTTCIYTGQEFVHETLDEAVESLKRLLEEDESN